MERKVHTEERIREGVTFSVMVVVLLLGGFLLGGRVKEKSRR